MHTTQEWWNAVKADPTKLATWLTAQYHGELGAAVRIEAYTEKYATEARDKLILRTIASQERDHAAWVHGLLATRGISPTDAHVDRYWREVLPEVDSLATGAAIGAHAEAMRLERIRTIAADESAPEDIRTVFQRILPQEVWHERVFRDLAGPEHMTATAAAQGRAMEAIGLVL